MDLFAWIVFGLVVGVVANALDPRPSRGGLLGSVVLGVTGALVGGFLANLVFGPGAGITGFNLTSFIVAVAGSLILLFIGRAVRKI